MLRVLKEKLNIEKGKGGILKQSSGASRNQKDSENDEDNPVLMKAYERYLKTEEFTSTSPLKYRRPLPPSLDQRVSFAKSTKDGKSQKSTS